MKILDVGSGPDSVAAQVFKDVEDKEIVRMDIDPAAKPDVLHDLTQPLPAHLHGRFDIVYASHVIEHIDRLKVIPTLSNLKAGLKNLGELWVVVPSLEWAALEILNRRNGPHIQGMIFGSQDSPWQYHRVGLTLADLRTVMEALGLVMRKAYQSPFGIAVDGETYRCIQNVAIAARYDGLDNPQQKRDNPGAGSRRLRKKKGR